MRLILIIAIAMLAFWPFALLKEAKNERFQYPTTQPKISKVEAAIRRIAPHLKPADAVTIGRSIHRHCDPALSLYMVAIVSKESNFHPSIISSTGDIGLAQVNPLYWPYSKTYLLTIDGNVAAACHILAIANRRGDWARYHSDTPRLRRKYRRQIESILKEIRSEKLS